MNIKKNGDTTKRRKTIILPHSRGDNFLPAYGTDVGDPGYFAEQDFYQDGLIDMFDYGEWYACYMEANPI
jgi:hypothetical protein